MQLVIHPDAQLEIIEAADWYERRAAGLGDALVIEIQAAFESIIGRPSVWPTWPGQNRWFFRFSGSSSIPAGSWHCLLQRTRCTDEPQSRARSTRCLGEAAPVGPGAVEKSVARRSACE